MRRHQVLLASALLCLGGCATVVHGPYQDVLIDSVPPGATAVVSATGSERGPLFLDKTKHSVTTPATVRLMRDNSYRVEFEKDGYKLASNQVVSSYDWVWAPISCGPCEAVGELPTYDMKGHALPLRFMEAAFYEYPKGFFRALGHGFRVLSPDSLLGNSYKLKPKDGGYFSNWHALGTPEITARLEPK